MSASRSSEAAPSVADACLLGEWARLVLATLVQSGVSDLWLSPGSRSTPFAWVAAHTPGLTVRAVVDERAAAFLALGHARVTGRPSALLCTSGSAAANYFPAVVEASLSHLPLLVLTADRPLDVQHAAAAQTIDQLKLFGDYARRFYDLGVPDSAPSALVGARRALSQAVADSRGPLPGPVHVNLRARKPLEPRAPQTEAEHALAAHVTTLLERPLARHAPAQVLANEAVLATARALREAGSSAIVVGPLPASSQSLAQPLAELSRLTGAPIFAEASSQVRYALADEPLSFPLFDWLLSAPDAAERHRPELLLCVGATPTSSAYERWAARVSRRFVLAEHGHPDALGSAELVASGDLHGALTALVAELGRERRAQGQEWVRGVRAAHERCAKRVAEALAAPRDVLSEGLAVKSVVESLPDGAVLALGNSLPIRDVDAYVTRAARLRVCAQRGANGIDGLVSGAIGSAVGSGAPTLLLLGDVSLLHDLSGLANWRLAPVPLVIALIDNAGGRIFDQLPAQKLYGPEPEAAKLWHTAPECDFAHAAATFGLEYQAPTTPDAIQSATRGALERRGTTLLHVRVGPTSAAEMRQAVLSALGADLASPSLARS